MHTPARILRAQCDDIPGRRPHLSFKEQDRRVAILDAAQHLMANHGRAAIRLTDFALAMRMATNTIRRLFPDLDNLLAQILHRHLQAIVRALAEIPQDAPNRAQARRAAYLAVTRTALGAPTEAHLLLIRDRHLLPEDEYGPLEAHRLAIGDILAGEHAKTALALLDMPELNAADIEAALAAITQRTPAEAPQRQPARPRLVPGTPTLHRPPEPPTLPDLNAAKRPPSGPH